MSTSPPQQLGTDGTSTLSGRKDAAGAVFCYAANAKGYAGLSVRWATPAARRVPRLIAHNTLYPGCVGWFTPPIELVTVYRRAYKAGKWKVYLRRFISHSARLRVTAAVQASLGEWFVRLTQMDIEAVLTVRSNGATLRTTTVVDEPVRAIFLYSGRTTPHSERACTMFSDFQHFMQKLRSECAR